MKAEQRGGQNQVINGVPEDLAVARQQRINGHQAGAARHHTVQTKVHPPGAAHPAEPGIEHQQSHHPDPEDRRRVARQADNAHDIIGDAIAPRRRQHAQRNTEARADENRHRRQLHGGREDADNVVHHRFPGQQRVAQIAVQQVDEIDAKLGGQRFIKPQLMVNLLVGTLVSVRANNRQHRVDGHDAANSEGQQQQAEQRNHHLQQPF